MDNMLFCLIHCLILLFSFPFDDFLGMNNAVSKNKKKKKKKKRRKETESSDEEAD